MFLISLLSIRGCKRATMRFITRLCRTCIPVTTFFLTGIIGYDRLKFSEIYASQNEILGTPQVKTVPALK